jgi:hypothetical protein
VGQVIEPAKHYLDGGQPAEIKQMLRELVERVEVSEEEVTLRYNFKNPKMKVARLVAPQERVKTMSQIKKVANHI